ncbi:MAG: HEAT repeat domain-containing protein [bacterium]|nr:HEAT repeat domain-containing protein [bacterium]
MIDESILEALVSDDESERIQAVKELARTRSREALAYLVEVERDDESSEVRDLARKAVQYIQKAIPAEKLSASVRTTTGSTRYAVYEQEDEQESVPQRQRDQAKDFFNQALDFHARGDNSRASDQLSRALKTNPALARDPYVLSTAASITGEDGHVAVAQLMKEKTAKRPKANPALAEWSDAAVEVGLYGMVSAGASFAILLILSAMLRPYVIDSAFGELLRNTRFFVVFALAIGVISILYLGLQSVFIHFVATGMLNGDGQLAGLVRRTALVSTLVTIAVTIYAGILLYVIPREAISGIAYDMDALLRVSQLYSSANASYAPDTTMLTGSVVEAINAVTNVVCLGLVGSLVILYFYGRAIGRSYRFGAGRGIVAYLISYVILQFVGGLIATPFSSAIFSTALRFI